MVIQSIRPEGGPGQQDFLAAGLLLINRTMRAIWRANGAAADRLVADVTVMSRLYYFLTGGSGGRRELIFEVILHLLSAASATSC
jgi:hypothetical protein